MIVSLIESLINAKLTTLATSTNPDLARATTMIDTEGQPTSLSSNHYRVILLDDDNEDSVGKNHFRVRARIDFSFSLANNQLTNYRNAFNNYLYPLKKLIHTTYSYSDNAVSTTMSLANMWAKMQNGDRVTTDYATPSLELTFDLFDTSIN